MQIPSKSYSESSLKYRFGFNGKENDSEVKGEGNQQDYGMRIYDPRLGRFLSVDPIFKHYAMLTPFQFASNSPISGVDLDGLEYINAEDAKIEVKNGEVLIKVENLSRAGRSSFRSAQEKYNGKVWHDEFGNANIGLGKSITSLEFSTRGQKSPTEMLRDRLPRLSTDPTKPLEPIPMLYNRNSGTFSSPTPPAPPAATTVSAGALLGINIAITAYSIYKPIAIGNDIDDIKSQFNLLATQVQQDLNYALKNNIIPVEFQNKQHLSELMDVIFSGTKSDTRLAIGVLANNIYQMGQKLRRDEKESRSIKIEKTSGLDFMNYGNKTIYRPSKIGSDKKESTGN